MKTGEYTVITNNPYFLKEPVKGEIRYMNFPPMKILTEARDLIHKGYILITHPLVGGIKPNQTPYRTVILSAGPGPVDIDSVRVIGDSILIMEKFLKVKPIPPMADDIKKDLAFLDYTLIKEALESR